MIILHYALGFPPYRSGGLTKFCIDLMGEQQRKGHRVALLWPGRMRGSSSKIKKRSTVDGINSYELINPLPVPLDEGVTEIDAFTRRGNEDIFRSFLKELGPDVIHIHTFMGLYVSFLSAAKACGIRVVFTTHDYYPICPRVTMFRNGKICEKASTCEECAQCNASALSIRTIKLMQSAMYRMLKNTALVKLLRRRHRINFSASEVQKMAMPLRTQNDYKKLKRYYREMLEKLDVVHFNSTVARDMYKKYFDIRVSKLIPITHAFIQDNRRKKEFSCEMLRIRYLGPQNRAKGFFLLRAALDRLWKLRKDFRLDIHFIPEEPAQYMNVHPAYDVADLESIFDNTDILIIPSIWAETFGYTVLEGLSFGVPLILSNTVGAKDILTLGAGIVINGITEDKLMETLNSLSCEDLVRMNKCIMENQRIMSLSEMSDRLMQECYVERGDMSVTD